MIRNCGNKESLLNLKQIWIKQMEVNLKIIQLTSKCLWNFQFLTYFIIKTWFFYDLKASCCPHFLSKPHCQLKTPHHLHNDRLEFNSHLLLSPQHSTYFISLIASHDYQCSMNDIFVRFNNLCRFGLRVREWLQTLSFFRCFLSTKKFHISFWLACVCLFMYVCLYLLIGAALTAQPSRLSTADSVAIFAAFVFYFSRFLRAF